MQNEQCRSCGAKVNQAKMPKGDLKDWQPGDGLRCWYSKHAAPCGRPTKTLHHGQRRPLCAEHVDNPQVMPKGTWFKASDLQTALEQYGWEHFDEVMALLGDSPAPKAASALITRRRNRVTDSLLVEVAEVYRKAWQAGDGPTRAVAEHFHTSHSSAARWVGLARKAGHLGAADGSRGGEVA